MTEANPGDRELHLEYSDPFQSPTERLGSEAGMRRLFLVHFSYKKIVQNERETRAIIEQRNTILPKLISGELRVGDRAPSD